MASNASWCWQQISTWGWEHHKNLHLEAINFHLSQNYNNSSIGGTGLACKGSNWQRLVLEDFLLSRLQPILNFLWSRTSPWRRTSLLNNYLGCLWLQYNYLQEIIFQYKFVAYECVKNWDETNIVVCVSPPHALSWTR